MTTRYSFTQAFPQDKRQQTSFLAKVGFWLQFTSGLRRSKSVTLTVGARGTTSGERPAEVETLRNSKFSGIIAETSRDFVPVSFLGFCLESLGITPSGNHRPLRSYGLCRTTCEAPGRRWSQWCHGSGTWITVTVIVTPGLFFFFVSRVYSASSASWLSVATLRLRTE